MCQIEEFLEHLFILKLNKIEFKDLNSELKSKQDGIQSGFFYTKMCVGITGLSSFNFAIKTCLARYSTNIL